VRFSVRRSSNVLGEVVDGLEEVNAEQRPYSP
jgi:hypothetical protein